MFKSISNTWSFGPGFFTKKKRDTYCLHFFNRVSEHRLVFEIGANCQDKDRNINSGHACCGTAIHWRQAVCARYCRNKCLARMERTLLYPATGTNVRFDGIIKNAQELIDFKIRASSYAKNRTRFFARCSSACPLNPPPGSAI